MTLAVLYGAGSGALHAVTGPDHLLSLGPAALTRAERPFVIGLRWGIGHALGTLVLSVPLLFASRMGALQAFAAIGDRLSGLALLVMGLWSAYALHKAKAAPLAQSARDPVWIGLVHGIAGAGSLVLLLPVLVSGSPEKTLSFLLAFAGGSTLAMAALTALLARVGRTFSSSVISRAQYALSYASILFGAGWLVA